MSKISRRDLLQYIGAGGVGVVGGVLYGEGVQRDVELLIPQVVPPEDYSPGVASWYNTVCNQCSAGCGISVRIREGKAKKIEGNPVHPVSQGRTCARGQAGLNGLYNPDRIRTPLQNVGQREKQLQLSPLHKDIERQPRELIATETQACNQDHRRSQLQIGVSQGKQTETTKQYGAE